MLNLQWSAVQHRSCYVWAQIIEDAMTSSIASRIEASFRKQGLMTTLGARITRIEPGCVEITAPLTPATQQQQGFAHAGLTFAIGDSAAGYSALSMMPAETEVLTSQMSIHLLACLMLTSAPEVEGSHCPPSHIWRAVAAVGSQVAWS